MGRVVREYAAVSGVRQVTPVPEPRNVESDQRPGPGAVSANFATSLARSVSPKKFFLMTISGHDIRVTMTTPGLGFFSMYLYDAMARQGVTARSLATKVGCSYQHIRNLTGAETLCSPSLIKKLCEALHLREGRAQKLIRLDQARKLGGKHFWESAGKDPRGEPFYIMWPYLTDQEREIIVASMRFLADKKKRGATESQ
jgi:hypothetical protein